MDPAEVKTSLKQLSSQHTGTQRIVNSITTIISNLETKPQKFLFFTSLRNRTLTKIISSTKQQKRTRDQASSEASAPQRKKQKTKKSKSKKD